MPNMSYCRFRNTLRDLRDCDYHWDEVDRDNSEERKAQAELLKLCQDIVESYG